MSILTERISRDLKTASNNAGITTPRQCYSLLVWGLFAALLGYWLLPETYGGNRFIAAVVLFIFVVGKGYTKSMRSPEPPKEK